MGFQRALVVDDAPDSAFLLARILKLTSVPVEVAHDAAKALQLAEKTAYDLIFLDIGLPVTNGFELAEALRRLPHLKHACVIAVTGFNGPDDRTRAAAAGFDVFLTKPLDLAVVRRLINAGAAHVRSTDV